MPAIAPMIVFTGGKPSKRKPKTIAQSDSNAAGPRLIRAAAEALAIARGELEPARKADNATE